MKKQSERSVILLICISLIWNVFAFSLPTTPNTKQGTSDAPRVQELQVELSAIKTLRLQIVTRTELISQRIERVKRHVQRLIKAPDTLTDDQINTLKNLAKGLVDANAEIKAGQKNIKDTVAELQRAIQAKQRKEMLQAYRALLGVQRDYLFTLKTINDELLADMDQLLEIKME